MSSTGTSMRSLICFLPEASTIVTGRYVAGFWSSENSSWISASIVAPCASRFRAHVCRPARSCRAEAAVRPRGRARLGPAEKPRHFVERALRRGQSDPLQGFVAGANRLEPLQRQREVRAALAWHERVDLVDDHGIDRAQPIARIRCEKEEQRLRRRDQNVGRLASEARAVGGRCVARPDRDLRNGDGGALGPGHVRDARQRRAQVPLDVDRERLQRRNVQDAAAFLRGRRRLEEQPVEAPEKRGQCLAAARRREDQRRFSARNRRPSERLCFRWHLERV